MKHLAPEYTYLFNAITKTIEELTEMTEMLKSYQQQSEELYIENE